MNQILTEADLVAHQVAALAAHLEQHYAWVGSDLDSRTKFALRMRTRFELPLATVEETIDNYRRRHVPLDDPGAV